MASLGSSSGSNSSSSSSTASSGSERPSSPKLSQNNNKSECSSPSESDSSTSTKGSQSGNENSEVESSEDPLSDNDDGEESPEVSIEKELAQEDRKLDERFTKAQLNHLLGLKERYRLASPRERREIAQNTGELFRDEIIQTGKVITEKETGYLFDVSSFTRHIFDVTNTAD